MSVAASARRLARPGPPSVAAAVPGGLAAPGPRHEQRRGGVFNAVARGGPIEALHGEVAARFKEVARGNPANISTAQLVQLIFEVGAADPRRTEAGEVLNRMMVHGFYGQTNEKRDSYGPPTVPVVGLEESKRWATLLFIDRLKQQERAAATLPAGVRKGGDRAATPGLSVGLVPLPHRPQRAADLRPPPQVLGAAPVGQRLSVSAAPPSPAAGCRTAR
eukprot:CAMPEP_0175591518 /NCGR_PEP_ID=MMETSP0096-20121207/52913_1 /TAXON_ID=311494 /ORGANISM="Alexandrium monilatum, Strain CCMP3105" /LENGTH=218 /DNA_ID=CAMNT_0016895663 /DNA_START=101 /DNA_END=752 /DNA_ORIENTATION=-